MSSLQNPYCGRDHPWTGWQHLLHQAWWNLILPVHSPGLWFITAHNLQHTIRRFRFVCLPLSLACAQDIFQQMMDQILTCCDGVIGTADDIVIHWKDDKEHGKHLHQFMTVAHEHGLVFNKDKCAVKQTSIVFLNVSMMPMELILTLKRLVQSIRYKHLRQQLSYRSSLDL